MEGYISRAEHEEFVKRMDDEHKRLDQRCMSLENANTQNQKLMLNVERMATNMENMLKEQQKQGKRLDALEEIPNKGWNTLKNGFYNAIGAAVGGAAIAAIIFFT